MARVPVVGGAGYIGGWLNDKAVEARHDVRVYDPLLYEERYLKNADFVAGDVLDSEGLHPYLDWADAVIWLEDQSCARDRKCARRVSDRKRSEDGCPNGFPSAGV